MDMDADAVKQQILKVLRVPREFRGGCAVIVLFALIVGLMIGVVGGYFAGNLKAPAESTMDVVDLEGLNQTAVDDSEVGGCTGIWVDIEGAVTMPGVYCMREDDIVKDVIDSAGGLSDDACLEWIARNMNSAGLLESNSMIYIPGGDASVCGGVAANESVDASPTFGCDGVNINTATVSELESLAGVGPSIAGKIVDGRPYSKTEDLLDVSGIGEATLEKFEAEICL